MILKCFDLSGKPALGGSWVGSPGGGGVLHQTPAYRHWVWYQTLPRLESRVRNTPGKRTSSAPEAPFATPQHRPNTPPIQEPVEPTNASLDTLLSRADNLGTDIRLYYPACRRHYPAEKKQTMGQLSGVHFFFKISGTYPAP